jgi:hypothetical protein
VRNTPQHETEPGSSSLRLGCDGGTDLMRQHSCDVETEPVGPRAAPHRGAHVEPVHEGQEG